jgi:hypothetical protein
LAIVLFFSFFFGRCVFRLSSICELWLLLWYLQTLLGDRLVRVASVTNLVISHGWGEDREVLTTGRTYPWSFVTQIFRNS